MNKIIHVEQGDFDNYQLYIDALEQSITYLSALLLIKEGHLGHPEIYIRVKNTDGLVLTLPHCRDGIDRNITKYLPIFTINISMRSHKGTTKMSRVIYTFDMCNKTAKRQEDGMTLIPEHSSGQITDQLQELFHAVCQMIVAQSFHDAQIARLWKNVEQIYAYSWK